MNTKALLAASLLVNVVALVTVASLLKQDPGDLSSLPPVIVCTAHVGSGGVIVPVASTGSNVNPPQVFDWRRVESEDYKQYLANLRGIGCPEKTIRDIVTADVNELYRMRADVQIHSTNRIRP